MEDWERARGVNCPKCGAETLRLVSRVCQHCSGRMATVSVERLQDRAMRTYYRTELRKGTISLAQMRRGGL